MQDIQQLIGMIRRYTSPKYLKRAAQVLLALALLTTLADRVVLALWPVAPETRGEMAKALAEAWPAGVAWINAHRDHLEIGAVLVAALAAGIYFALRAYARRAQAAQNERLAADAEVLLLRMDPDDGSPIDTAANLFLALRQAMACSPWRAFRGQALHASLEVVAFKGKIGFLVWTPGALKEAVMLQVQAHYPDAAVETIADPLRGHDDESLAAVEMGLTADSIYPIRTDFGKGDPLTGYLSALAPHAQTSVMGLQFIFRPAGGGWQQRGAEEVARMRQQIAATETGMVGKADKSRLEQIERKKDQLGYEVTVRAFGAGADRGRVQQMAQAFGQFAGLNSFAVTRQSLDWQTVRSRAYPLGGRKSVLNVEEFAAAWHPPGKRTPNPNLVWAGARVLPPPVGVIVSDEEYRAGKCRIIGSFTYPDGRTVNLGWRRVAGSAPASYDALTHGYILGPTGSGKSTIMLNMIMDDVEHGCGVVAMEPHHDLVNAILERVPSHRWADVIVLNAADEERPFGFNFMECPNPADRSILAAGIMGIFQKVSSQPWGVQMLEIMESTLLALLETHTNATMYTIYNFLTDLDFREQVLGRVKDPITRRYWENFNERKDAEQQRVLEAPLRRLTTFLRAPLVRNIVSQPESTIRFRQFMDSRKIILISLSTHSLGGPNAELLGALFVSMFWRAAASRRDVPEEQRVPTYYWIDEFQNYVTPEIASILAEARKFGLGMCFANQFFAQVAQASPLVADAVKGNCGTKMTYRLGSPEDTALMLAMMGDALKKRDLGTLPKFTLYTRLMSGKQTTEKPFTMAAPKPRGVPAGDGSPLVLGDEKARRLPPREQVPDGVVALVKEMPGLPHDQKVGRLAELPDADFALYQRIRRALDWKRRNELLRSGGNGMSVPQLLAEASRLTIGTPAYEVEAIIRRAERGGGRAGAAAGGGELLGKDWL
jgi:hypothetical protein